MLCFHVNLFHLNGQNNLKFNEKIDKFDVKGKLARFRSLRGSTKLIVRVAYLKVITLCDIAHNLTPIVGCIV